MAPENEKNETLEEIVVDDSNSKEAKEEPKQETVIVDEAPKAKTKARKRKSKSVQSKSVSEKDVDEVKSSIPKARPTGFKKTEVKIMSGRPRSGFKKDTKKDEKSSKNNRIANRKKGFDFE